MGEEEYYPIVRKWLEKKGYYCGGLIEDSKGNPTKSLYKLTSLDSNSLSSISSLIIF